MEPAAPGATASTLQRLISDIRKGIPTQRLQTLITPEIAKAVCEKGLFLAYTIDVSFRGLKYYFHYDS
jgi:hypothetical protein